MINRDKVTLTLPKELIKITDEKRGLIPRSRYFELIISGFLDKKDAVVKKDQSNTAQPPRRKVSQ